MGLLGLLVTILLMILGAGYFLFGASGDPITLENKKVEEVSVPDVETGANGMAKYQAIVDEAGNAKDRLERRAVETMRQDEEPIAGVPSKSEGAIPSNQLTEKINIMERRVDFGFEVPKEARNIDTIILHSSYNSTGGNPYSVDKVIDIWRGYGVAPHYMIDRQGILFRLVDDANIAYHAGVSKMPDGRTNVNDFSIGIEILNTKDDKYTEAQYDAVNNLIAYLRGKYRIKQVVGHADIAPGRKDDPWHFNWKQLK